MARSNRCWHCHLGQKVSETLSVDGQIPAQLQPLADDLINMPRPASGWTWLTTSPIAAVTLQDLAAGRTPLTHDGLDALPPSRAIEHIRQLLVLSTVLPPRDRHLAQFRRWTRATCDSIASAEHQGLVRRFVRWDVDRKLTQRSHTRPVPASSMLHAKQRITVTIQFLEWLQQRGVALAACTQRDIDSWFSAGPTTRKHAAPFIRWARKQRILRGITIPPRTTRTSPTLGNNQRIEHLRDVLLHDRLLLHYRLIAALVLLFGQSMSRIVTLTRDDVALTRTTVQLRLSDDWIELPEPVAALLRTHLERLGNRRTAGAEWLFPGVTPGEHLHVHGVSHALRKAGIPPLAARNSTWLQLVRDAPPALLAQTLGISPKTAMQHAARAGSDYQAYAAQRARQRDAD